MIEENNIKINKNKIYYGIWSIIRGILILGISFVILYPVLSKISFAFMEEADLYDRSVRYVPKNFTLSNFARAWEAMEYPQTFLTTFTFSLINGLLQMISCTIVGYGFARFNFRYKNIFFILVIISMVVPPQTILIPLYVNFRTLNLINSLSPFVLLSISATGLKNGLYIFIMRQFFTGLPKELDDASLVDGCGPIRTFYRIVIPNSVPMMVTIFLFSFVWSWADSFYTGMLAPQMNVMSQVLNAMIADAQRTVDSTIGVSSLMYRLLLNNTASLLTVVPLIILFIFGQRYFIESVERSGIVG